jgi:hypothetical protein
MPMAKAVDGTWEPGAGAKEPSGVGAWNGRRGVVGTGEALGGPEPAGLGKQGLPITGKPPGSGGRPSGSRRVVGPPDGLGQHNPARGKDPASSARMLEGADR